MKYGLVLTGKFKRGLKLAQKRGLNISLLEDIVEKLLHKIPLETRNRDHALKRIEQKRNLNILKVPFRAEDGT